MQIFGMLLTDCQAELEHVDCPFLLQEVHEAEQKVLLFSDFLQFQLQHLMKGEGADLARSNQGSLGTGSSNTHRWLFAASVRVLLQERNQGGDGFCSLFGLKEQTSCLSSVA